MKKLYFLLGAFLITSTALFAQSKTEEIELLQSIFGMEKKAMVKGFIKLEGDATTTFWNVYDKYEAERKVHGQKRIELLSKYAEHYDQLNDEKIDELMKEMNSQKKSIDKLIVKYYKQVKKASGSKVAAQFLQIENYILSATRLSIFESIPFIGEMDN